MRRDERILELALERWSQRQIAAEVGLTQGGVSKALRRVLTPLYVKTRVQAAWMSSWRARKSVMTRW